MRKRCLAIILSCFLIVTAMTACSADNAEPHTHTEALLWTANGTSHWKTCDTCDEKLQTGDHALNDESVCTVCGNTVYDFGDFIGVYTYDRYDNLTWFAEFDGNGKLNSETVYEYVYDADGNITSSKTYTDGQLTDESEYTVINGESVIVKCTGYNEDGTVLVSEYDENGNAIKVTGYSAGGDVEYLSEMEYARNGDGEWYQAKSSETYADGSKLQMEYNEKGYTVSSVRTEADGTVLRNNWEYTYDENGYLQTEKVYTNGVLEQESTYGVVTESDGMYTYTETSVFYESDGSKTVYAYNENGELVSETKYDASGNVIE